MAKNLFKMGAALAAFALLGISPTVAKADNSFNTYTTADWNGSDVANPNTWSPAGSTKTIGQSFTTTSAAGGPSGAYFNFAFQVKGPASGSTAIAYTAMIYSWNGTKIGNTTAVWSSSTLTYTPTNNAFTSLSVSGNIAGGLAAGQYIMVITALAHSDANIQLAFGKTTNSDATIKTPGFGAYDSTQTTTATMQTGAWVSNAGPKNEYVFAANFSSSPEGNSLAMLAMGGLPLLGMGFRRLRKK